MESLKNVKDINPNEFVRYTGNTIPNQFTEGKMYIVHKVYEDIRGIRINVKSDDNGCPDNGMGLNNFKKIIVNQDEECPDYSQRVLKGDKVIFKTDEYNNFTEGKEYIVDYVTQDNRPKIYVTGDNGKDDWSFAHHFEPVIKRDSMTNSIKSLNDTELWITEELKNLFEFDVTGSKSIITGISKGETIEQLFERADKRRPSSYVQMLKKLWKETILVNLPNMPIVKNNIVMLGNKIPFQYMPTLKENTMPKTMITIEKKRLENEFNDMMLDLAIDVITGYFEEDDIAYELDSFEVYNKDAFNEAFEGTRKKTRNIYVGRAMALKSMIDYFGVYVNKTGHQMLSVLIAADND